LLNPSKRSEVGSVLRLLTRPRLALRKKRLSTSARMLQSFLRPLSRKRRLMRARLNPSQGNSNGWADSLKVAAESAHRHTSASGRYGAGLAMATSSSDFGRRRESLLRLRWLPTSLWLARSWMPGRFGRWSGTLVTYTVALLSRPTPPPHSEPGFTSAVGARPSNGRKARSASEVEFPHPKTGSGIPPNSQEFPGIPGNSHSRAWC